MQSMTPEQLAAEYLAALRLGDADQMLTLFAPDALVDSPLYGPTPAAEFYPQLFADTRDARLRLLGVAQGATVSGSASVHVWFHFDWQLANGRIAPLDVVDVMELDDDGRICVLHRVYDTFDVRPEFEQETRRRSWRRNDTR
jgi:SnoaL-like domain